MALSTPELDQDPNADLNRRRQRLLSSGGQQTTGLMGLAQEKSPAEESLSKDPLRGGDISTPPESEMPAPLSTEAVPRSPAMMTTNPLLGPNERLGATVGETERGEITPDQAFAPFQQMAPQARNKALMSFFRPQSQAQEDQGFDVGGAVKNKAISELKQEFRNRTFDALKSRLNLNEVETGGPGAGGPAQQGHVGAEEAFPGASTAGTSGSPEAFAAMLAEAGLPGFPAGAAGFSEMGNIIPGLESLWSAGEAGAGLAGGSASAAGSAIGAGAEGGIAAGGAGSLGTAAGGSIAGAVAIPLAALTLATMLQGPGKTTDLAGMAKYDPLGIGGILGSLGGSRNKNYSRNFFGNLASGRRSIGTAFDTLRAGLPGAKTQEDLAQLVDNFRSQVHDETGIEAYGMPHGPGTEGQQYRRSGPLDIPGLPGIGAKTHGQPTTPFEWESEIAPKFREAIAYAARRLPSGGQTLIPSWASQNQPTTASQFTPPEGYRNFEGSWYGGPENSRLEDLSPYTKDVTSYPAQTYAAAGPAYGGFEGPPDVGGRPMGAPQPGPGLFKSPPTQPGVAPTLSAGRGLQELAMNLPWNAQQPSANRLQRLQAFQTMDPQQRNLMRLLSGDR